MDEIERNVIRCHAQLYEISEERLLSGARHKDKVARDAVVYFLQVRYKRTSTHIAKLLKFSSSTVVKRSIERHVARTKMPIEMPPFI